MNLNGTRDQWRHTSVPTFVLLRTPHWARHFVLSSPPPLVIDRSWATNDTLIHTRWEQLSASDSFIFGQHPLILTTFRPCPSQTCIPVSTLDPVPFRLPARCPGGDEHRSRSLADDPEWFCFDLIYTSRVSGTKTKKIVPMRSKS